MRLTKLFHLGQEFTSSIDLDRWPQSNPKIDLEIQTTSISFNLCGESLETFPLADTCLPVVVEFVELLSLVAQGQEFSERPGIDLEFESELGEPTFDLRNR